MKQSIFNLKENIVAALSYFWVFGVVALILEKDSKFVRFHAMQSILFNICVFILTSVLRVLTRVPVLGFIPGLANSIIGLGAFIVLIFTAYMAFKETEYKLPIIGDVAFKQINK